MKKIFICSPYRGNIEENIKKAKQHAELVAVLGKLPIAPHLYFTQFLDDNNEKERQIGINLGIELLKMCDLMYVYGEPTDGMKQEIKVAEELGIEIIKM